MRARRWGRRQWLRGMIVGVAAVAIAGAVWGPASSQPAGDNRPTAEQLLDLLARSRSLTYHVRYAVTSDDPDVAASTLYVEVWRAGADRVRHDAVEQGPSSRAEARLLRNKGETTRCDRLDQDPWACTPVTDPELAAFDDIVGAVTAYLDDGVVTERAEQVRGVDLRCFAILTRSGDNAELCTDADGVPHLLRFGDARFEWVELTGGFPPSVFTAPAQRRPAPASAPAEPVVVSDPPAPQPLQLSLAGATAELDLPEPGTTVLACGDAAATSLGSFADLDLAPALGRQPGSARVNLDVKPDGGSAFLLPDQSSVTLATAHGAVRLDLAAGTCGTPGLTWDGAHTAGAGTWSVRPEYTTDGYRQTSGGGTFQLAARLGPGRDNPWTLDLDGDLTVLQPALSAEMVRSFWGRLGADYAGRVLTVVYRIRNHGPGDAFVGRLTTPTAPTGIEPIEFRPAVLGDLAPGETVDVTVRYKVGLRGGSKGPLLIRRSFDGAVNATVDDALDVAHALSLPVHVVAPANPPAL